jgi:alpha-beta hydrolase superfamily lysophospholipase
MITKHNEYTLHNRDGTMIVAQHWLAEAARADLLVVPGYAEHAGRYQELAANLAEVGVTTLAVDLRGHGKSSGRRGFVRTFSDYHTDIETALDCLDDLPRFVLGHSMGGLVALDWLAAGNPSLTGLILTSPFLALATELPTVKRWVARAAGRLVPTLTLPSGIEPRALSHDRAVVEAYASDPLVFHGATAGWLRETLAAQARVRALVTIPVPLFHAYAEADEIVSVAANRLLAETLVAPDKTVRPCPGAFHEVLNESDRHELHREIGSWIIAHLPG